LLLMLGACESWDWRATGQALVQSVCYSIGNCSNACQSGEDSAGVCR
jgi:hypothetical protein